VLKIQNFRVKKIQKFRVKKSKKNRVKNPSNFVFNFQQAYLAVFFSVASEISVAF